MHKIKNNIIYLDIPSNFQPNNNIIINTHNNTHINNTHINIKIHKENIKTSLYNIKTKYYKLLTDIDNVNSMLIDLKQYNNLDITNISDVVNKHLLDLKSCLINFNNSINELHTNLNNNIINLDKTTNLLVVNKNKDENCCCLLI